MSAHKYQCKFSRQMEAIVYIDHRRRHKMKFKTQVEPRAVRQVVSPQSFGHFMTYIISTVYIRV